MSTDAERNATLIAGRSALAPSVGIVLGSGLGDFGDEVAEGTLIPYDALAGFPAASVSGHKGALILGLVSGTPVAVLSGRAHYYESGRADAMRGPLETLRALGVTDLVLTNAAGSLRESVGPGSAMLITDHINLSGANPLIGEKSDARFVGMTAAYDPKLLDAAREAAQAEALALAEGVYMWLSGPTFETPAEIRAFRVLGADAVGMSTVPEAILARFLGMRVVAFSAVTNYAAGMTGDELSHAETKAVAPEAGAKLRLILKRMLSAWPR
jgi:purine-nucleoside phosphorylase